MSINANSIELMMKETECANSLQRPTTQISEIEEKQERIPDKNP